MAKYTRFDPRNKKQNRNKTNYNLNRDMKIHQTSSKKKVRPEYSIEDANPGDDYYFEDYS